MCPWIGGCAHLMAEQTEGGTGPGLQVTALNFQGWFIELTDREHISGPLRPENIGSTELVCIYLQFLSLSAKMCAHRGTTRNERTLSTDLSGTVKVWPL